MKTELDKTNKRYLEKNRVKIKFSIERKDKINKIIGYCTFFVDLAKCIFLTNKAHIVNHGFVDFIFCNELFIF